MPLTEASNVGAPPAPHTALIMLSDIPRQCRGIIFGVALPAFIQASSRIRLSFANKFAVPLSSIYFN